MYVASPSVLDLVVRVVAVRRLQRVDRVDELVDERRGLLGQLGDARPPSR